MKLVILDAATFCHLYVLTLLIWNLRYLKLKENLWFCFFQSYLSVFVCQSYMSPCFFFFIFVILNAAVNSTVVGSELYSWIPLWLSCLQRYPMFLFFSVCLPIGRAVISINNFQLWRYVLVFLFLKNGLHMKDHS